MRIHQLLPQILTAIAYSAITIALTTYCWMKSVRAEESDLEHLVCCGAAEVFVIDAADPHAKLWTWTAGDSPSIPEDFRPKFRSTDDCKPYSDGLMLITSSSRGVALIQRDTKHCLFLADVANAHSACLLPDGQIAVAASTSGDEVQFFSYDYSTEPNTLAVSMPAQRIPLLGAHGTMWDATRNQLWALGTDELLQLQHDGTDRNAHAWNVVARHQLPSWGGHDLSSAQDDSYLFVTTDTEVLRFNMDELCFEITEGFGDQKKVKSVDVHPQTKRIVYQQAVTVHGLD